MPLGRRRRRSDDNKINHEDMDASGRPKDRDTVHDRVQGLGYCERDKETWFCREGCSGFLDQLSGRRTLFQRFS